MEYKDPPSLGRKRSSSAIAPPDPKKPKVCNCAIHYDGKCYLSVEHAQIGAPIEPEEEILHKKCWNCDCLDEEDAAMDTA